MPLLGMFGPPNIAAMAAKRDAEGLVQALSYLKDEHIREDAAKALGQVKCGDAVDPLMTILENINECDTLRTAAAAALGDIGDARASGCLLRAITRSTTPVAMAAAAALQRLDPDSISSALADATILRRLFERLPDRKNGLYEPVTALLMSLGTPAAEALASILQDSDLTWDRKGMVAETLASMGELAIEPLQHVYKGKDEMGGRQLAIEALGRIGGERALQVLIAALQDREITIRWRAAAALKSLHWQPSTAPERVLWAMATEDWQAIAGMGSIALDPLIAELENTAGRHRPGIAKALGEIGDDRSVEPLARALETATPALATSALAALVKFGAKAVRPLAEYLDRGGEYSKQAVVVLGQLVAENTNLLPDEDLQFLSSLECSVIKRMQWSADPANSEDQRVVEYREMVDCSAIRQCARKEQLRRSQY